MDRVGTTAGWSAAWRFGLVCLVVLILIPLATLLLPSLSLDVRPTPPPDPTPSEGPSQGSRPVAGPVPAPLDQEAPKSPGPDLKATVVRPDGRPLAGARVYLSRERTGVDIIDGAVSPRDRNDKELVTGPDGTFVIPDSDKPFLAVVLGDDAFALASQAALATSPKVQARPYGRIEGQLLVGGRPAANQQMEIHAGFRDESAPFCGVYLQSMATTDRDGRFTLERLVPLPRLRISRRRRLWYLGEPVRVVAGETTRITIGGNGRPVVGRVLAPEGFKGSINFSVGSMVRIESNRPLTPYPLELVRGKVNLNDLTPYKWSQKWDQSPEGIAYHESRVAGEIEVAPDGSFRFDALPAGDYRLSIRINEAAPGQGPFDRVVKEFTVPPFSGPRQPEPLDIGEIRLTVRKSREGQPEPDFQVKTVDGKTVRLADYRGKFLLLDFGAMWEDGCVLGIPSLNEIYQRFGKDGRLAMLSLVMAADDEKSRAFVAAKGEPWPQAIIGPMSNPISIAYGIDDELPAAVLIDPDGKIYPRKFELKWTIKSIARALGQWRPPSPDDFLPREPITPGSP